CFAVNAFSFVPVLLVLLSLRLPNSHRSASRLPPSATLAFLLHRPRLLLLLMMAAGMAFFGWPLLSLLPALADRRLGLGQSGCGGLLSAVGAGALVAALLVANLSTRYGRLVALIGGVLSAASGLASLAWVQSFALGLLGAALCGLGLILFLACGQTAIQLQADDHNRGQLMGLWLTVLAVAHPLGHLGAGALADRWGVETVLGLQAVGLLGLGGGLGLVAVVLSRGDTDHRLSQR
ncbi:MAG: MFS transporter, partial [Gemmataceae bacterium]